MMEYGKNPSNLNDKINVTGSSRNLYSFILITRHFYFSSDGLPGMGGMDIYVSRRDKNGDWGDPVNLGYPINTIKDENSFTVSGDGKTAYFASDRPGGYGGLGLIFIRAA